MRSAPLRPLRGRDPLGLRRALADRLLPALVGAMALLAALALAAAAGAGHLAARWQAAADGPAILTLPAGTPDTALAPLHAHAGLAPVAEARLRALLAPWLGDAPALPLPRVLEAAPRDPAAFRAAVEAIPGARLEGRGESLAPALRLATGLRVLALGLLAVTGAVAAALVAVATRAGIAARRDTIVILHELGARDADIAGRFAARLGALCAAGAAAGLALALAALAVIVPAAVPVALSRPAGWADLPWAWLALLPPGFAALGWAVARWTVARWLRRLP
ncbi:FtsX-like permease family protein [Roseococcus sp. DSY-14]|uniref:FtsX-like permease family protein n=1 Tax=Roseococcus sp. DSY-14 TaxID=3369650 RepID=UPI00387A8F52